MIQSNNYISSARFHPVIAIYGFYLKAYLSYGFLFEKNWKHSFGIQLRILEKESLMIYIYNSYIVISKEKIQNPLICINFF